MERLVTREEIVEAVEKIGFTHINDRRLTTHRDDWYLWVVCGQKVRKVDGQKEFACWLYNAEQKGLSEGVYTEDGAYMMEKFYTKK